MKNGTSPATTISKELQTKSAIHFSVLLVKDQNLETVVGFDEGFEFCCVELSTNEPTKYHTTVTKLLVSTAWIIWQNATFFSFSHRLIVRTYVFSIYCGSVDRPPGFLLTSLY